MITPLTGAISSEAERIVVCQFAFEIWQFQVGDVTKFRLGVVGDSQRHGSIAVVEDPLVGLAVLEVSGYIHSLISSSVRVRSVAQRL